MEAVLHQVLDRFPRLGEKIFNQLDNQNLTKCEESDNSLNEFLKENKVLWMRMIKNTMSTTGNSKMTGNQ